MHVLLTGNGGFVGHHCLQFFLENTDWTFTCVDSFHLKGSWLRVQETVWMNPRVNIITHDLTQPVAIDGRDIDLIVNIASDSEVEKSIADPAACLRNNFELQVNMLEFARKCPRLKMFLHLSTDEVYGEALAQSHKEWAPILPSNPYAASKASQECMSIAYWRSYGIPVVIANCTNIIGERQDTVKFLPKIIQKVLREEPMPIYTETTGQATRIYLDARDLAAGLLAMISAGPAMYGAAPEPHRYNVSGVSEVGNLAMAEMVSRVIGKDLIFEFVESAVVRPGHDRRYSLDDAKLRALGWKPSITLLESLDRIVRFSVENPHWIA